MGDPAVNRYNFARFRTILYVVRDILTIHIAHRDEDELPHWLWSDVQNAMTALEALDRALARAACAQEDET